MKAKLIKTEEGYTLNDLEGNPIGQTFGKFKGKKLSLKNCQAIERGYDLDELAKEDADLRFGRKGEEELWLTRVTGIEYGFNLALEILGDKKFSDIDVKRAMRMIFDWSEGEDDHSECTSLNELWDKYFESTQQTEWDCIVEMEKVKDETKIIGSVKGVKGSGHKITTYKSVPVFDADGCLILKRK